MAEPEEPGAEQLAVLGVLRADSELQPTHREDSDRVVKPYRTETDSRLAMSGKSTADLGLWAILGASPSASPTTPPPAALPPPEKEPLLPWWGWGIVAVSAITVLWATRKTTDSLRDWPDYAMADGRDPPAPKRLHPLSPDEDLARAFDKHAELLWSEDL